MSSDNHLSSDSCCPEGCLSLYLRVKSSSCLLVQFLLKLLVCPSFFQGTCAMPAATLESITTGWSPSALRCIKYFGHNAGNHPLEESQTCSSLKCFFFFFLWEKHPCLSYLILFHPKLTCFYLTQKFCSFISLSHFDLCECPYLGSHLIGRMDLFTCFITVECYKDPEKWPACCYGPLAVFWDGQTSRSLLGGKVCCVLVDGCLTVLQNQVTFYSASHKTILSLLQLKQKVQEHI